MIGLCLKLALLVGFAVQVAHHVVVPDLADARARKDRKRRRRGRHSARLLFPLAVTLAAMVAVALWGETLLALFGPEFAGAKLPLLILMACQFARALFGPSGPLLTVIGAQKENAALALATMAVLAAGNLVLAPLYGVLGAAMAVALATLFWLVASAVVLMRLSGLRTDALYLLEGLGCPAARRPSRRAVELDRPGLIELLLGLLGGEQRGENEPRHEGRQPSGGRWPRQFCRNVGASVEWSLAEAGTVAKSDGRDQSRLTPAGSALHRKRHGTLRTGRTRPNAAVGPEPTKSSSSFAPPIATIASFPSYLRPASNICSMIMRAPASRT